MNLRIKQLLFSLNLHHLDAFLVTKDVNIRYLTEFPASESWLLVSPRGISYITDFRYILEAKKSLKGITIKRYTHSFSRTLFELASSLKLKKIGFDDRHISLAAFKRIKTACPSKIKLVAVNNLIEDLREIKSASEISQIRKAISLNLMAIDFLKKVIRPGLSEREVLLRLETFVKSRKAGFSFDPIIASGPNSCFPHAKVTDRRIKNNEPVLVDMGIDLNGYKSDLTRMFFLGKIPRSVLEVNDFVRRAQQEAIAKIKAGVLAHEIDQQARNYLVNNKLGKFFGHSLGHGVGLEIHEAPSISTRSPSILKENMVFTVEPAVYIPGKFGIRIEDMVLVTKNGCEVLTNDIN